MHIIAVVDRESRASGTGHTPVASYKVDDIAASRGLGVSHKNIDDSFPNILIAT